MSGGGGGGGGGEGEGCWNPPAGSKRKTRTPHSDVGNNYVICVTYQHGMVNRFFLKGRGSRFWAKLE